MGVRDRQTDQMQVLFRCLTRSPRHGLAADVNSQTAAALEKSPRLPYREIFDALTLSVAIREQGVKDHDSEIAGVLLCRAPSSRSRIGQH